MDGRSSSSSPSRSSRSGPRALRREERAVDTIDWFLAHQANQRINKYVREHLKVPREKMPMNIDRFGNTSAATIPILIDEADARRQPQEGRAQHAPRARGRHSLGLRARSLVRPVRWQRRSARTALPSTHEELRSRDRRPATVSRSLVLRCATRRRAAYCRTVTVGAPRSTSDCRGCYEAPAGQPALIPLWWSNACVGYGVQKDASKQIVLRRR